MTTLQVAPDTFSPSLSALGVKLFADGADIDGILSLARNPLIRGFTTNPTLMRKAGITDYATFARQVLDAIQDRPISFEAFADDELELERQARIISGWGDNVYVKIPVTTTMAQPMSKLVTRLTRDGIRVNVTGLMTLQQVSEIANALAAGSPACISVFAGRVADTGRDPLPMMAEAVRILAPHPQIELIWASPRELLNVFHADSIGCHIITVTHDILAKLVIVGKDLDVYSLETVKMFYDDAARAGYTI